MSQTIQEKNKALVLDALVDAEVGLLLRTHCLTSGTTQPLRSIGRLSISSTARISRLAAVLRGFPWDFCRAEKIGSRPSAT